MKTFDELLSQRLTDIVNQGGAVTEEVVIREACSAAAEWGLYYEIEQAKKQIFPDTSDHDGLLHHGADRGLAPVTGETDAEFLGRVQDDERMPPAGGNQYDYKKWAEEIDGVSAAFPFPLAQGDGTLDLVVVSDIGATGSEVPSNSSRIGNTTGAATGKLIAAGAAFLTGLAIAVGDIVENPAKRKSTTVAGVDSANQISLADDIFKYANEGYIIYHHTGTSTTVTPGKLIDAAAAFTNAGYPAIKGDVVDCLDDNTSAVITSVNGAGDLSLSADIFTALNKRYVVRGLVARVKKNIEIKRPVGATLVSVLPPILLPENVVMGVQGDAADRAKIALDIAAYQNSLEPAQTMALSQLIAIAIQNGAEDLLLTTPAANVVPAGYQMIRPGAITVT